MVNCLKLTSKNELSEESRRAFISLIQQYDDGAEIETEKSKTILITLDHTIPDQDLKELSETWGETNDNFLIEYEGGQEDTGHKKLDIKDLFDNMNEELNIRLHDRMVEEKTSKGWRYGDRYDPANKTSPLMKPYLDLPKSYRKPDKNILRDVLNVLENNGFIITHKKKISK